MGGWKPSSEEAAFLGQLVAIDIGLADIARGQLAKGLPLREVIAGLKAATNLVRAIRTPPPCPMCSSQIDPDTRACPSCKEIVA
jgi:hypothetical protein